MEPFPSNINSNLYDHEGRLPIHIAALSGQHLLFKNILKQGSYIHTLDNFHRNILHFACKSGNVKLVGEILNLINGEQYSFADYMIAAQCRYVQQEYTYRMQIECACKAPLWVQIHVHRKLLCKFLVNLRLPYTQRCKDMHTFGVILERQCTNVECTLNTTEENISHEGYDEFNDLTPLMTAILNKKNHLVPLLLKEYTDRDLHKEDKFGFTILHHACIMGSLETIQCLLDAKAFTVSEIGLNISMKGTLSYRDLALQNNHSHIVEFLMGLLSYIERVNLFSKMDASTALRDLKEEKLMSIVKQDGDIVDYVLKTMDELLAAVTQFCSLLLRRQ